MHVLLLMNYRFLVHIP